MSIRIHELAKKIGMDNKQLLALLKERKYDVKSVSSTIDNISAEAISQEFASQVPAASAVEPAVEAPVVPAAPAKPTGSSEAMPSFTTKLPAGAMVRSVQDIVREKEEIAAAAKAAAAAAQPPRVVIPQPAPRVAPAPSVVSRPAPLPPPAPVVRSPPPQVPSLPRPP